MEETFEGNIKVRVMGNMVMKNIGTKYEGFTGSEGRERGRIVIQMMVKNKDRGEVGLMRTKIV